MVVESCQQDNKYRRYSTFSDPTPVINGFSQILQASRWRPVYAKTPDPNFLFFSCKSQKNINLFFCCFFFFKSDCESTLQCMMGRTTGFSANPLLRKCLDAHKTRCDCLSRSSNAPNSCKIQFPIRIQQFLSSRHSKNRVTAPFFGSCVISLLVLAVFLLKWRPF